MTQNCVIFDGPGTTHHKIARIPVSYFQVPRVKLASFIGVLFYGDFSDVSFPTTHASKTEGYNTAPENFLLGWDLGSFILPSLIFLSVRLFVCFFFFNKTKLVENKEFQTPIYIYYYFGIER